jgi:hypothetical protein
MPEIIPVLEPAAQEFTDSTAKPPFLYEMAPEKGRIIVDSVQDGEVPQPPVDVTSLEAYRFRRQFYYAAFAIPLSNTDSYSAGDRYPSSF